MEIKQLNEQYTSILKPSSCKNEAEEKLYALLNDGELMESGITEKYFIQRMEDVLKDLIADGCYDEMEDQIPVIKTLQDAKEFGKELCWELVEMEEDSEMSLILNNIYKHNSTIVFKTKNNGGYWTGTVKILSIKNGNVRAAYHAQRHVPSGYLDNNVEKSGSPRFYVDAYKDLEHMIKTMNKNYLREATTLHIVNVK